MQGFAGGSRLRMPENYRSRGSNSPASSVEGSRAGRFGFVEPGFERNFGSRASLDGVIERGPYHDSHGALSRGDHIRVAVRVRPLPSQEDGIIEVQGRESIYIRKDAATGGNEFLRSQQSRVEERTFDQVFGPEASQRDVYNWSCKPLLQTAVTEGRSATIFVYGATGAGKTYTMFGPSSGSCARASESRNRGLMFRAIPEIFDALPGKGASSSEGEAETEGNFQVKVSFLEIYNEVVRDLLNPSNGIHQCRVLEDERRGIVKVQNLYEAPVQSADEALWFLEQGMQVRTVEATAANSQSSRAHAVFSLTIEHVKSQYSGHRNQPRHTGEMRRMHSKISLIDLAGSERAAITQNSGNALKDGARINQSLLALANCIDALTARTGIATMRKKAPYRDSKLTLMLKNSLIGDGMVAMIANVHPGRRHFEDSNNTLEYARRASAVRSHSRRNCRLSCPASPAADDLIQCRALLSKVCAFSRSVDENIDMCNTGIPSPRLLPPRPHGFSNKMKHARDGDQPHAHGYPHEQSQGNAYQHDSGEFATTASNGEDFTTASNAEDNLSEISLCSPAGRDVDDEDERKSDDPEPYQHEPLFTPVEMGIPEELDQDLGRGVDDDLHSIVQTFRAEKEALRAEKEALRAEKDGLLAVQEHIRAEKAHMQVEMEALMKEHKRVVQANSEKDAQLAEKDSQIFSLLKRLRN